MHASCLLLFIEQITPLTILALSQAVETMMMYNPGKQ